MNGPPRAESGGGWCPGAAVLAALICLLLGPGGAGEVAPAHGNDSTESGAAAPDLHELHVDADRDTIAVGDPLRLLVWLESDAGTPVELPEPDAGLGDFELRSERPALAATMAGGVVRHQVEWTVSAFRVGPARLPPLTARVGAGAELVTVTSDTLTIEVASVLVAAGADSLADIHGLKDLIDLPVPLDWRPWVGAALIGLLLGLGWSCWRRRRRRLRALPRRFGPLDLRSPEEWALAELDRLRSAELPQRAAFAEHYTRLTEIVRPYIEGRFRIHAADRTTAEVMTLLGGCVDPTYTDEQASRLAALFAEADLVKFARLEPAVPAAIGAVEQAAEFVRATGRGGGRTALDDRDARGAPPNAPEGQA